MNIVQMILKPLSSSDALGSIASMLGIGRDQAGEAVSAAVPTMLAGLTGAADRPGGGASLANVLAKQDFGVLDHLSSLFSNTGSNTASQGANVLSSLLGGGALDQIGNVLSRFTGLGTGTTNKLLGLLGPVVLGAIGKQSRGLDASGITHLLDDQKHNIASALPSGLAPMLSSALPDLDGVLEETPQVSYEQMGARNMASTARGTSSREVRPADSSFMKWLIPLLVAGLALLLLSRSFNRQATRGPVGTPAASHTVAAPISSSRIVNDATTLIGDATRALTSVTDEASATAALPKLGDITKQIGGLHSQMAQLPEPAQRTVGNSLRPLIDKLREAAQPVLAMPIIGEKIKPTVDGLLTQLEQLAPAA